MVRETTARDLPKVGTTEEDYRRAVSRSREEIQRLLGFSGDGLDMAVTWRQLAAQGFVDISKVAARRPGGSPPGDLVVPGNVIVGSTDPTPDLTPPPDVVGLGAVAGITYVLPSWTAPVAYTQGHGHYATRIYGAKRNPGDPNAVFGDATLQYEAIGALTFVAIPSEPNIRWHLWAKNITNDGVESINPVGGINGVIVTTGQDVTHLLQVLTGQITETQLYPALVAKINVPPAFEAFQTWDFTNTADGWTSSGLTRTNGAEAITLTSTGIDPVFVSPASLGIVGARYDKIRARVKRTAGTGWDGTAYYAINSGHGESVSFYKNIANTTVLNQWVVLEWDMAALTVGGTDWLTSTIEHIRLDLGATASDVFQVDWVTIGRSGTGISQAVFASEQTTRAGADSAMASDITTLYSATGTNSAAITTEASTRSAYDGQVAASYSVRAQVTAGGRTVVGGFGLFGTIGSPGAEIEFGVRADRFYIGASSSATGVADVLPFIVQTADTVINGVTIPKGVYMQSAYIYDLTASIARLGNAWIDNAMVANLSAAKLTVGDGTVGGNLKSTTFTAGSAGWIVRPDGTAEFGFAHIRGTLQAGQIAANYIIASMIGAGEVTAAKISVTNLAAINADLGEVTAGAIRGVNVNASSHTTKGTYLTSAASAAAGTLNVKNTADFASSGTGVFSDTTNDRDVFTYSGKTGTTLTGCSGVLAHNNGATVVPLAKGMVIDANTNEMRFFGDRGDSTIEELASIGITSYGGDTVVGFFGSQNSGSTRLGLVGVGYAGGGVLGGSNSNDGVQGVSVSGAGVRGISQSTTSAGTSGSNSSTGPGMSGSTSGSGAGVIGSSNSGSGVKGSSTSGYGGEFAGNATKGPLVLSGPYTSAPPSGVGAGQLAFVTTPFAGYRLCFTDGADWRLVSTSQVWNDPGSTGA